MIVRTKQDLHEALGMLQRKHRWSFDIETTGTNFRKDSVIGFGCASTDDLEGFYVIMKEWVNGQLVELFTREDILPILKTLSKRALIGWNFAFDASFILYHYGIDLMQALHCDVMLVVHCCDENKFNYGLKQISAEIFGASATQEQEDLKESIKVNGGMPKEFYKANSDIMAKYGLQDNILTCKNYNYWLPILEKEGLTKFYFEDEVLPLYKEVTFWMQYRGVPVDVPLLTQAQSEIAVDLELLEAEIQSEIKQYLQPFEAWYIRTKYPVKMGGEFKQALSEYLSVPNWPLTKNGTASFARVDIERAVKKGLITTDSLLYKFAYEREQIPENVVHEVQLLLLQKSGTKYPFNLLSTDHLKRLFFEKHGGPLKEKALSFTEKGAPQINDEFLEAMAAKYPWAAKLQVYRGLNKLKGTYIDRILEEQEDGMFYPSFHQHRTVSGRYSGDIQQLPRPLEHGDLRILKYTNLVRRFFIAGPGYKFVDDDYESLEPHIFAHVSGDEKLRDIFRQNRDFYSTIAIDTEGLQGVSADKSAPNYLGKVNKTARQKAKAYCLGIPYGMSGYKLAFELNIPQEDAEVLVQNYLGAYPDLHKWMLQSKEMACIYGYVKTISGRKRRFPELKRAYAQYGDILFDSLKLWKEYHEQPQTYEQMKRVASIAKNSVNNASNIQIQGFAASIINKASIALARDFKARQMQSYICAAVHDELIIRSPEAEVDEAARLVQYNMENAWPLSIQLKAIPSVGCNFAEAKG